MSASEDEQSGIPLFEGLLDSGAPSQLVSTKRKRTEDADATAKKAKKRKKSKKPQDVVDEALDVESGVNQAISFMDGRLMADHIAQRTKRFNPEMTAVETDDIHLPDKAIIDTTSWEKPRTTDELPDFLEQFALPRRKKKGSKLTDPPLDKGSPHTLVIASAGLRAADLTRVLRKFQTKQALIAKLFAKHIKLKEAQEMVKKNRINIGIGTPQRIIDLLDSGALSSTHLERVIVDASHIDMKKRGILDMKETQVPLMQLLTRTDFKQKYGGGKDGRIDLLFF